MAKNTSYIFSTLANDQTYQNWQSGEGGVPQPAHKVFVKGGAGVANDRLVTPLGVATEVSDLDLAELEKNSVFVLHRKNGFITIRSKSADPEKVAADMNRADKSAPLTPANVLDHAPEGMAVATNG